MNFDFLSPIDDTVISEFEDRHPSCLGQRIVKHSKGHIPDLSNVKIALFGIRENRRESNRTQERFNFNNLRRSLYALFSGNWHTKIADLGDILPGKDLSDTEFVICETIGQLLKKNIIPIILGGSQDLSYSQYRAYDNHKSMVNLVNIDAKFDIGNIEEEIGDHSYIGSMIVNKPYNLFNYANIGYQTYLNPPEEIDLIERLFFEAYRLGEISSDISLSEPVLRDADLVSMDMSSISSTAAEFLRNRPNGFDGREICALARYAGISDKVSSFGLYNIHHLRPASDNYLLPAEILWYYIEGVNFRKNEGEISTTNQFIKYSVPLDNEILTFYKSKHSGRWWVKIPVYVNNKLKSNTFLPCSHQDYLDACNQKIPDRWYKARRRNEL